MTRSRRLARITLVALAVISLGGATGCGARAGEGRLVPPSTSPK